MSRFHWLAGVLALAAAGCTPPPASVYVAGGPTAAAVPIGRDAVGEPCRYQVTPTRQAALGARRSASVFCGTWEQPSARIFELSGPADPARLGALARTGPWRAYIDQRFACAAPGATRILNGAPAQLLECRRRSGGWPHLALTAAVNGRIFAADGVRPSLPVIEATLAVLSGERSLAAHPPLSPAERLIASRVRGAAFGSGDEGRYHTLMALGDAYNNVDDWAHAEQAFREALAIQQRFLKPDNPGLALTMMKLAAQIAHQRQGPEPDRLLARAAALTARSGDKLLVAQLHYYRAVTDAYQGNTVAALREAKAAERVFASVLPRDALALGARPLVADFGRTIPLALVGSSRGGLSTQTALADFDASLSSTNTSLTGRAAISGFAETLRLHASLLALGGDTLQSTALAHRARRLLEANGLALSSTGARALRLIAANQAQSSDYSAAATYSSQAARVFNSVVPGERPDALNALDDGAYRLREGDTAGALALFRLAGAILRKPTVVSGAPPGSIYPWINLLYGEGEKNPAARPRLNAEMFEAAQLAKGNITAQDIAEAAARLAAGNPKVALVLRRLQQEQRQYAALGRERDALVASSNPARGQRLKALDARIAATQKRLAEAESEAQEAAPLYRRTIEEPVTEAEVRGLLQPDEALISIFVAPQGSYGFLIERNRTISYKIALNQGQIAALIHHLRATVLPKVVQGRVELPRYDTKEAYRLYAALFGPVIGALRNQSQLVLAPSGALLSFPLEALVTEPNVAVENGDYRKVPWLVRRFALSFIPAPRTFVDLRRIKAGSPGTRPFIGFGDFIPPTDRQIAALFPPNRCAEDNRNLHLLGRLPGTRAEVIGIGRELGARPGDIVLGAAFTKARLARMDLARYRIIDLATHALLPSELGKCQTEPAILTSTPPGAASADAGFLRPADIEKLKLDADLVVLSACDTAGPGNGGGESLTGLARAFFRAGTRGMLVTHWATLDLAAMRLMTGTIGAAATGGKEDTAQALRAAQLKMIDSAGSGKNAPMLLSDPFAWAPFVLIGDGVRIRARGV